MKEVILKMVIQEGIRDRLSKIFYCEECDFNNIETLLEQKTVTVKEIKMKLPNSDFKFNLGHIFAFANLINLGYIYFECPKCGWWKFIKSDELYKYKEWDVKKWLLKRSGTN